jgi:cephalosporin hydroxylase
MIDLVASIADAMVGQNAINGALKTQADLDRYKVVLAETDPDLIVELGTLNGMSALWLADNSNAKVLTIDIQPQLHAMVVAAWGQRVRQEWGDSASPELAAKVAAVAAQFERVMVILDSDHGAGHVYAEMTNYGPLVTPGCFLVVEDGLVRWMPWFNMGDGPLAAVEKYQQEHPGMFENDTRIESLSERTQNIGGWLRRQTLEEEPSHTDID